MAVAPTTLQVSFMRQAPIKDLRSFDRRKKVNQNRSDFDLRGGMAVAPTTLQVSFMRQAHSDEGSVA